MNGGPPPIERAVLAAVPFLVVGLAASLLLLAVPASWDRQAVFLVQLSLLVLLGLSAAIRLTPFAGDEWFVDQGWSTLVRLIASGVSVVFLVTGVVGLVALASSAAQRFQPSLQFLQLLSALDIAWAGAAIVVGAWRLWGRTAGIVGGVMLGAACVASIWNYLARVDLSVEDGWLFRVDDLARLVLPFDAIAAVVAVAVFFFGARRAAQAIEQAKPQS